MAGGSELAAACDLVYLADDATISHPVLRVVGTPDFAVHPWLVGVRNAMEMVLTGDAMDAMGARTAIRAATDLGSIASHVPTIQENMVDLRNRIRDAATGD